MKMISIRRTALSMVVLACFAGAPSGALEDEAAGKQLFVDQKCDRCHSVTSLEIEAKIKGAMSGPALDESAEREATWIRDYLTGEQKNDGKAHRAAWKGSEEELDRLVAFLVALREQPKGG